MRKNSAPKKKKEECNRKGKRKEQTRKRRGYWENMKGIPKRRRQTENNRNGTYNRKKGNKKWKAENNPRKIKEYGEHQHNRTKKVEDIDKQTSKVIKMQKNTHKSDRLGSPEKEGRFKCEGKWGGKCGGPNDNMEKGGTYQNKCMAVGSASQKEKYHIRRCAC